MKDKTSELVSEEETQQDETADRGDEASENSPKSGLINLEDLRLSQNFTDACGVEEILTSVSVRKPGQQEFFRVHPAKEYQFSTVMFENKEERELYLVSKELWPRLQGEPGFGARAVFTCLNRQGVVFLWAARLPRDDGRTDNWAQSGLVAARKAITAWVRMRADMNLGAYRADIAVGQLPDPEWPEFSFEELLSEAFKEHIIDSQDHDVLRRLRGEI